MEECCPEMIPFEVLFKVRKLGNDKKKEESIPFQCVLTSWRFSIVTLEGANTKCQNSRGVDLDLV